MCARLNSKGFTLVEALTAIAILIVSMLAVLNTLTVALDHNLNSAMRDEATMIAEERLNSLRNSSFASLATSSDTVQRNFRNLTKTFTVAVTVQNLSATSRGVQVVVTWTHKGVSHQHSVSSIITS